MERTFCVRNGEAIQLAEHQRPEASSKSDDAAAASAEDFEPQSEKTWVVSGEGDAGREDETLGTSEASLETHTDDDEDDETEEDTTIYLPNIAESTNALLP